MNCARPAALALALASTAAACIADFSPELAEAPAKDASKRDAGIVSYRDAESARAPDEPGLGVGATDTDDEHADTLVPGRESGRERCDLTGDWLLAERMVLNAVGARQVITVLYLVQLEQTGEAFTVRQSLLCGDFVRGLAPIVITMDSSKAWDALRMRLNTPGRTGSSRADGNACAISFSRAVEVRGATASAYEDVDVPLPKRDQMASGSVPGWEDWDEDGNPGISLRISGSLNGTLYVVSRSWTEMSGTADPGARSFTLPLRWNQQRVPLGVEGSPLLASPGGAPDADASQHMVELAFMGSDELGSTDDERCARIRELAPTRTPKAMR